MRTPPPDQAEITLGDAGSRWVVVSAGIAIGALAVSLVGGLGSAHSRELFFRSYLVSYMFVLSLALGGLFFVLVSHLTRSGWNVSLRRLAEVAAWSVLPLSFFALPILFGMHDLYEWTHQDAVAADPLLEHKRPYLNTTFFMVRFVFYFVVWNVLASFFLRRSVTQDRTKDPRITIQLERLSAPGTIFYAMTVTFAAFDWMMSLNPHWYSTIYGVYYFAGAVLGFFSLIPILVGLLRGKGKLSRSVNAGHFHDVGKFMFAFVVFWAYIAFSQYFLIWYGNLPEETIFFEVRQQGPWLTLTLVLLFGHFVLPFFWLLSRHPKRHPSTLIGAAVWLLVMHWLDLFWLIVPEGRLHGPAFHWLDLTCLIGLVAVFFSFLLWRLGRGYLVPVGDPRLQESLGLENV